MDVFSSSGCSSRKWHGSSSSFQLKSSHTLAGRLLQRSHIAAVHAAARGRLRLAVTNRLPESKKVVYVPNLLHPDDFATVQQECRKLQPQLKEELNCIASGRLGCYLGPASSSVRIFSSKEVTQRVSQLLRARFPLFMSGFPVELRQYPVGAAMPWHKDEQMYASPQWELIYTVENSSNSMTEWRDEAGREHSIWTEPNSLLAVEAEGWDHRVLPSKHGVRTILKMAYTCTNVKLPAFDENLAREAYAG